MMKMEVGRWGKWKVVMGKVKGEGVEVDLKDKGERREVEGEVKGLVR